MKTIQPNNLARGSYGTLLEWQGRANRGYINFRTIFYDGLYQTIHTPFVAVVLTIVVINTELLVN